MRIKKEGAVSTRLAEAPTAHSSITIAAALHGGKSSARSIAGAVVAAHSSGSTGSLYFFRCVADTVCGSLECVYGAAAVSHREAARVRARHMGAVTRADERWRRTSSHNNALLQKTERKRNVGRRLGLFRFAFHRLTAQPGWRGVNSTCRASTVEEMAGLDQTDLGEVQIARVAAAAKAKLSPLAPP